MNVNLTQVEIIDENTNRKIDALGRISVPKGLRNRLRLEPNQEMAFYTVRILDKDYIAFAPVGMYDEEEAKYALVADLLTELGVDIPDEVLEHV